MAWACAEYLANQIKSYTLFATHYFELTCLAAQHNNIHNIHLDAIEHDESIIFSYQVKDGPASKSYGLQVAKLAGIQREVIAQAKQKLAELEVQTKTGPVVTQAAVAAPKPSTLEVALDGIDPDDHNPREALELLYHLKSLRD